MRYQDVLKRLGDLAEQAVEEGCFAGDGLSTADLDHIEDFCDRLEDMIEFMRAGAPA